MGFLVGVGALQFAYCVLVGNYVGGPLFFIFSYRLLLAICFVLWGWIGEVMDGWVVGRIDM